MQEVVTQEQQEVATYSAGTGQLVLDSNSFDSIMRFADMMAKGVSTVPKHLQGNPADCAAVIMQAMQWKMHPYAVAQKTHLVSGTLGYEAQLVNAVVQASGFIDGRFHYEYTGEGDKMQCRVGAVIRGEHGITWGEWLSSSSVKVKNSPLWVTNPKQQIGYLQVKNWARQYCPGAILGVYTNDELEEIPARRERDITPPGSIGEAAVRQAQAAAAEEAGITDEERETEIMRLELVALDGVDAFRSAWTALPEPMKAAIGIAERNRIDALARAWDETKRKADAQQEAVQLSDGHVVAEQVASHD
jgi:hypothetical protein